MDKLSTLRNLFLTITAIVWMYFLKNNRYLGKVYSQLIITAIIAIFVIYNLLKMSKFNLKRKHIIYSLGFGVGLISHGLSGFILSQFDRIIINQISGSYEPVLKEESFFNSRVISDLDEFKKISDVIVTNRLCDKLSDVSEKIYTRDLFARD